ncbi:MAG: dialkylresorcinol condensing enzyme [Candidatus Thiodiazotropha weberae]|nr:dialkylresorcinol condensing enzyme [Candidatus Thiodiazotropha lotti]MCG8010750.1 dialkylresorcinol condensing enzyme [Candidatus Thiodiazotropha lotti]MCW4210209.1 dialkylresorcinol condensing enzyme [Candidatus Thiodiazotropha lotti]MCW4215396.1 dialkylresorcinol condensing enzyme [Candidatus Thiodiazotropha lotti]
MKKILVLQFSQTGQLSNIVQSISAPLQESTGIELKTETLQPLDPYPFPWPFFRFLDVFPECVYLDAPELQPLQIDTDYDADLVILAYQVWFLAPALPITGFLQSEQAKRLLSGKPVITVIGCRNMWTRAQETMKAMLDDCGARLIDNVVLTDQGSLLASFITTPRWLWTGKKEPFWGFPAAGVSDQDIQACCRFGQAIEQGLGEDAEKTEGPMLRGLQAVEADVSQIQSEKVGYRSFLIWGKLLRRIGKQGDSKRTPVLAVYVVFLILMIVTVVPLSMFLKALLVPLMKQRHQQIKTYFEAPSGSGSERMEEFGCGK